jgi:hypothetical protein
MMTFARNTHLRAHVLPQREHVSADIRVLVVETLNHDLDEVIAGLDFCANTQRQTCHYNSGTCMERNGHAIGWTARQVYDSVACDN